MFWMMVIVIALILICKDEKKNPGNKAAATRRRMREFEDVRYIRVKGYDSLRRESFETEYQVSPTFCEDRTSFFIDSSLPLLDRFDFYWNSVRFFNAAGKELPIQLNRYKKDIYPSIECLFLNYYSAA